MNLTLVTDGAQCCECRRPARYRFTFKRTTELTLCRSDTVAMFKALELLV